MALWLSDLELPTEIAELVKAHSGFFDPAKAPTQAAKRKEQLKKLLNNDDTLGQIRMKIPAVCVGASKLDEDRIDTVLEMLLAELEQALEESEQAPLFGLIQCCALDGFFGSK